MTIKTTLATLSLLILTACGNDTNNSDTSVAKSVPTTDLQAVMSVDAYRPEIEPEQLQASPMKARDLRAAPTAVNISLGLPLASQEATARNNNAVNADDHMGKPLQIGFARAVSQTATAATTRQVLKWQATSSGGQAAAINYSSTGAKGVRIGLLVNQLPETATLRFYAKDAVTAFEVKGAEVLTVLAANKAAGDTSDNARTYWGPVIDGSNGTLEIEIPIGVDASSVSVSIPIVTHLFMSTKESSTALSQVTYSGDTNSGLSCQVDVKCTTPLPAASDAVAHIKFNANGNAYICSGTMLNNTSNDGTPYFVTANHCITNQTVASTLQTWFQYRALTCNDGTTGEYYPTVTTGAALLYTAYATDSTLMRLYGTPSAVNVLYAGWDSAAPTTSTVVHSIHHPKGDQQRLSRGSVTGYYTRDATNSGLFYGSNIASGTIVAATLTTGLTEPGSSGSGLFKGADSNPQLIGTLYGGSPPACGASPVNVYGRFDVAYSAGMSDWLTQGVKTVTQLYKASTGVHYYTIGVTDVSNVINANAGYVSQGSAFKASTVMAAGLSPVYRFYDTVNGTTFYTISEKERAAVATNTPRMRYDGIVWYAYATPAAGRDPLYRAFNTVTGSQFFTVNNTVRTNFIAANPQFKTDGIAYYVQP